MDSQIEYLSEFYVKVTQEKIEELKPVFNNFVEKGDFASMMALNMSFENVKRALYIRDTLKAQLEDVQE